MVAVLPPALGEASSTAASCELPGGLARPVEQLGVGGHEIVDRSDRDAVGDEVRGHAGRPRGELGVGPAVLDDGRQVVRVPPRERHSRRIR